jgi:predicted Rossmann fold nucleotide-binding protein DprA/Smf involved in DNA uptake
MSDAIARMTFYLCQAKPWKPDRFDRTGPVFTPQPGTARQITPDRNPALKARILTELQKGKATSDQIAKRLGLPQQEVGAKLSRLYKDGHVERAMTAISIHTGRKVLVYWLRDNA